MKNFAIKKQQGVERLVLGRFGYIPVDGQIGQKILDLGLAHLCGMANPMEADVSLDPPEVSRFGPPAVVA